MANEKADVNVLIVGIRVRAYKDHFQFSFVVLLSVCLVSFTVHIATLQFFFSLKQGIENLKKEKVAKKSTV